MHPNAVKARVAVAVGVAGAEAEKLVAVVPEAVGVVGEVEAVHWTSWVCLEI